MQETDATMHHVAALEQRLGGAQAEAVDLLVDAGLLLDVGVGLRNVGLGLVVVVVGDEVLDRVVAGRSARNSWKSCAASVLLCDRTRVGRLTALDDLGDREGLARSR